MPPLLRPDRSVPVGAETRADISQNQHGQDLSAAGEETCISADPGATKGERVREYIVHATGYTCKLGFVFFWSVVQHTFI